MWEYTSAVIAMEACPSASCTRFIGYPASSMSVAAIWQQSGSRTGRSLSRASVGSQWYLYTPVAGNGSPVGVANTKPRSMQDSPATSFSDQPGSEQTMRARCTKYVGRLDGTLILLSRSLTVSCVSLSLR